MDDHPSKGPQTALDRFSDRAANAASKAPLLLFVLTLALLWVVSHYAFPSSTAILIEAFEVITLLLVVVLQNSERRAEGAINRKLDRQAEALASLVADAAPELRQRLLDSIELEERK
jgi:low affinity Fe/Cu permease